MRWRALILDWNGTVLDDLPVVYGSVIEIFRAYGLPPPSLQSYKEEITADFIQFYCGHGIPKPKNEAELNTLRTTLNQIRKHYFLKHWNEVKVRPGTRELLILAQKTGMQTAIVSAEVEEVLEKRLFDFALTDLFDRVEGNAWDKERALVNTFDFFGLKAEETVYIDDTFDGLTAANNVGAGTIGFTDGYNTEERIRAAKPNFPNGTLSKIDSMQQVIAIIKHVNWGV
ncbi:HAD family hydrolase [Candidatus Jorgensenbacteria bacterium]|nr:HAD family hydrolase [Candidatus Jorgensenbacteria bacterium]